MILENGSENMIKQFFWVGVAFLIFISLISVAPCVHTHLGLLYPNGTVVTWEDPFPTRYICNCSEHIPEKRDLVLNNTILFYDGMKDGMFNGWDYVGNSADVIDMVVANGTYSAKIEVNLRDSFINNSRRIVVKNISYFGSVVISEKFRVNTFGISTCGSGYILVNTDVGTIYAQAIKYVDNETGRIQYTHGKTSKDYRDYPNIVNLSKRTWYQYKVILNFHNGTQSAFIDGIYLGTVPMKTSLGKKVNWSTGIDSIIVAGSSAYIDGNDDHILRFDDFTVKSYVYDVPVMINLGFF